MKRIAAPRSWPVQRKGSVFIRVPEGPHIQGNSVSLNMLFKDLLNLAKTTKEARYVIFNKEVLVNGKKVTNDKMQFGVFDVLALPEAEQYYTLVLNSRGKLTPLEITKEQSKEKLSRIEKKTYLQGKKIQLNLFGGMSMLVEKDQYRVGDILVVSLSDLKIKNHIKLEKGVLVYLLTGKHIAETVKVEKVDGSTIVCKSGENEFEVDKSAAYVVGKEKPILSI